MIRRVFALALSLLLLFTAACADAVRPENTDPDDSGHNLPLPPDPPLGDHPPEDSSPEDRLPEEEIRGEAGPPADSAASGEEGDPGEESGAGEGRRTIEAEKPMVALTYDDGPHAQYTDQLLDILEENRAVATFFEVGRYLYNDADAVRRAEALGCEVGSHSYRHADLGKLSREAILADLEKADANFQDVLGHKPNLLRPPYGSLSKTLRGATGRSLIAWSIDTEDWLSRDVEKILASVRSAGDLDGQVILMHSTYDTSVEASRILIPWLIEEGYQLVTVTELITLHYGDTLQANGLYNYEYFHFGRPVSLPAAAPSQPPATEQPPADVPAPPPETPEPPEDPDQDPTDPEPPEDPNGGQENPDQPPTDEPPGETSPTDPDNGQSPTDTAPGENQSDPANPPPAGSDSGDTTPAETPETEE